MNDAALRARTRMVPIGDCKPRTEARLVEFGQTCLNQPDDVVAVCGRTALMRRGAAN